MFKANRVLLLLMLVVPQLGFCLERDISAAQDLAGGIDVERGIDAKAAAMLFEAELDSLRLEYDAVITGSRLEQSVSLQGEGGLDEPGSCTATATVSVPGFTEITLSSTASTCEEAAVMIIEAIQALLRRYASLTP